MWRSASAATSKGAFNSTRAEIGHDRSRERTPERRALEKALPKGQAIAALAASRRLAARD